MRRYGEPDDFRKRTRADRIQEKAICGESRPQPILKATAAFFLSDINNLRKEEYYDEKELRSFMRWSDAEAYIATLSNPDISYIIEITEDFDDVDSDDDFDTLDFQSDEPDETEEF